MIFLAYGREDTHSAVVLERELRENGVQLVKDAPAYESNPNWRAVVREQLLASEALLILWSQHAAESPWVDQEIRTFPGPRIWLCLDATRPSQPARGKDIVGSDPRELVVQLRSRFGGRSAPPPEVEFGEPWRRVEAIEAARRAAKSPKESDRPVRQLRQVDEDTLLLEEFGMRFRRVTVDVFLGQGPVTARQFEELIREMELNQHSATRGASTLPVVGVTWFEAMACANWLGGTLPSEKEWELAAATPAGLCFATADGSINSDLAWYEREFATHGPCAAESYPPNPLGFHGMCGNTWDWCASDWGDHRVIRGGSWLDSAYFCRAKARYRNTPVDRDCSIGFRVRLRTRMTRSGHYEII